MMSGINEMKRILTCYWQQPWFSLSPLDAHAAAYSGASERPEDSLQTYLQ
jgi:hypothetical protein